jgi:hypothetical protein
MARGDRRACPAGPQILFGTRAWSVLCSILEFLALVLNLAGILLKADRTGRTLAPWAYQRIPYQLTPCLRHERALARVVSDGPYDLANPVLRENGVSAAAVRLSRVVEQWLGFTPPRPESCRQCIAGSYCAYWLIPPVRQNLVCMVCGAGRGS